MDTKALLKFTGLLGFIIMIIATSVYMVYIVIPAAMPLIIHSIEARLSSEGISLSQSEISAIMSITEIITPIALAIASFIGWLISSAVLWALLKAFRINNKFTETWLLTGNAFYLNVVQTAIIAAAPPLLSYVITTVAEHRSILTQPPLLAIGLASTILSAVLLAYIFSRAYGVGMTRALVPTLIALLIFWVISTVA